MLNVRALALGTVVGLLVALVPSCGGNKCGPNNCNGCCDSMGKCVSSPNNSNNTTCGAQGNACTDCTVVQQVCNDTTHVCLPTNTGGGGGAGGGSGGGAGGGSGCAGCMSGATCLPGSSVNNCGSNGQACQACPSGQLCTNNTCMVPMVTKKIGDACTNNTDCQSIGPTAICKQRTSSGNGTYLGGYCTLPCNSANDSVCGSAAFCVGLDPRYGEGDRFCWDRCGSGDPCRTPGYACYTVGANAGCWLNPIPQQDAGPPADKIGNPCGMDNQCTNPPDQGGACLTRDDSLGLRFPEGYCTKDFCDYDEECSADGGALCIGFGQNDFRCMRHCAMGGSVSDAGQSDCRNGYRCLSITLADGGDSTDGICLPPPPPPPTTVGQACTDNAACEQPAGTIADCIRENVPLSDGGSQPTGYRGGYCSRFNCGADSECGPNMTGLCLLVDQATNFTACFARCAAGGMGQSNCRDANYVCQSFRQPDGGSSVDGYCDPSCVVTGCATGRTCNMTTGYCM